MVRPARAMRVMVITPVGPGHEVLAPEAGRSVQKAFHSDRGPFGDVFHILIPDTSGRMGPSRARNWGIDMAIREGADWFFFLDADDRMMPDAFGLVDLGAPATFGAIQLDGRITRENRYPVTRGDLFLHGASGTLSMGCFVRADLGIRFDESLRLAEDFDFYLRLPGFTKIDKPLVDIGYSKPSAGTTLCPKERGWKEACMAVVERYRDTENVVT